ncbi:hypothetical protein FoTM2_010470 [Fusarium oxysporum f. sp. vasinfectum]|nr:hypothetical protein QWA68_005112 [Fusarium oxysporum]KAK2930130.1 hypothetical protein FoTM2_010470 [Fusarium oxysporum f. sp. vasinfectum]
MVLALTEQQRKKIIAMDIFGHQQFVSGLKVWKHQNCIFSSMASDGCMDMYVQHLDAHALAAYNVVGLVVVGH